MITWLKNLFQRKQKDLVMSTEKAHVRLVVPMEDNAESSEDTNIVDFQGFKDKKFYKVVAKDLDHVVQIVELTIRGLSMYQRYKQSAILRDQCIMSLHTLRQQLAHAKAAAEGKNGKA